MLRSGRPSQAAKNFQLASSKKKYSIYFIQEMHCAENIKNDWRAEWGYPALFSCCTSKKAGVAILF